MRLGERVLQSAEGLDFISITHFYWTHFIKVAQARLRSILTETLQLRTFIGMKMIQTELWFTNETYTLCPVQVINRQAYLNKTDDLWTSRNLSD
jgi:hypothetical protein